MFVKTVIRSALLIALFSPNYFSYDAYADGTLGAAQPVSINPFSPIHQPGVAMRENGEAVAVWSRAFNSTTQALYRQDRNSAWTVIATFGSQTGGSTPPAVLMNDAGDAVVAWGGANGIYVRFKRRGETTFQPLRVIEVVGTQSDQQRASAALNTAGDFVVAWKDVEGPPFTNKTRILFHGADEAWPPGPAATLWPAADIETVTDADGVPFVALDDDRNIALFYSRTYYSLEDDPGPFADIRQMLKINGNWSAETLITPATQYSGEEACNSSFTGAPDAQIEGITSNSKTGQIFLVANLDTTSRAYKSYTIDGEFREGCIYSPEEDRTNYGLAKFPGTVASGVGGYVFIYEAADYRVRTAKIDLNGDKGAVSFTSQSFGILNPTTPHLFFGTGSPTPGNASSIYSSQGLFATEVAIGGEGTVFVAAQRTGAGEYYSFIKPPNGPIEGPISMLPFGAYPGIASNCKGDAVFVLLGYSGGGGDGRVYVADYTNAKTSCDGSTEPPVPTPTIDPNATPEPTPNVDFCPDDPNKAGPLKCGCGFPELDSNNDGIVDCGVIEPVRPFTVINNAPIISPINGGMILTLQGFNGASQTALRASAAKAPKLTYEYEVTAKLRDSKLKCAKRVVNSKKNVVTLKKLLNGTYDVSYKVVFKKGKRKAGATSSSPTASGDVTGGKDKCPPKKKKKK